MGVIIDALAYAFTNAAKRARVKSNDNVYSLKNPTPWFSAALGLEKGTLQNPYKQVDTIYTCVSRKARNIASVPFKITRLGSDKELSDSYPIVKLFKNPNPFMSFADLVQMIVTSLDLKGEWFLWPDDTAVVDGLPPAFWFVQSQNVETLPAGWRIKMNNTKRDFDYKQVAHGRYIDLDNPRRGLPPLQILDKIGKLRFNTIAYTESFFENDATPTVTYETDKSMSHTQVTEFNKMLDIRRGQKGWHKELLLYNGLKANSIGVSQKDMQLIETLGLTKESIRQVFGVPQSELDSNAANYATANIEDRGFWKKTLIPIMRFGIEPGLNLLLNQYGYNGTFDLQSIDVLNQELLEKVEAGYKLYMMGVPFNRINDRLGYGFDPIPGGDEPRTQGIAPLVSDQSTQDDQGKPPAKNLKQIISQAEINKALRTVEWKKQNDKLIDIEQGAARAVKKYFSDLRRKWLKHAPDEVYIKATKAETPSLDDLVKDLSDEKLRNYLKKYMEQALQKGIDSIDKQESVSFSLSDDKAIYALTRRLDKIKGINETIRNDLRDMFIDLTAEQRQMSEAELAKYLRDQTEHILDMADGRARTIARTEMHGAYADGRWEAAKDTEPLGLEWIDSRDSVVRDSHQIDGEKIFMNDHFSNGLQYPGDPSGKAEEVINCRCKFRCIYDKEEM